MTFSTAVCFLIATTALGTPAHEAKALNIGDPAPPLQVAKWLRGKPVAGFTKGRIAVIHFWATWDAPSTDLGNDDVEPGPGDDRNPLWRMAEKYQGKVDFLSINVDTYDNRTLPADAAKPKPEEVLALVTEFVMQSNGHLCEAVAADGVDGSMAKSWLRAAGERFPGAVFVIDQTGRVAWIGSRDPRDRMDCMPTLLRRYYDADEVSQLVSFKRIQEVVDGTLAGTLDVKGLAERRARSQRVTALEEKIGQKILASKASEALRDLDRALAQEPALRASMSLYHVSLLLSFEETRGCTRVRELLAGPLKDDAENLRLILQALLFGPVEALEGDRLPSDCARLAVTVARRVVQLVEAEGGEASSRGQSSAYAHQDLARAYAKSGDAAKAVEAQKRALALAEKHLGKNEKLLQPFRDYLARYQDQAKGQRK